MINSKLLEVVEIFIKSHNEIVIERRKNFPFLFPKHRDVERYILFVLNKRA
jgi:hypothetical protein